MLSLPAVIAPYKVGVAGISQDAGLKTMNSDISEFQFWFEQIKLLIIVRKLRKAGLASRVDDSSVSIGKKYSRADELGTAFFVTTDFACESLSS